MSVQTDNIIYKLKQFGFSDEESFVYLYLLEKRCATALNISKDLHLGRTKVYRILDRLYSLGLSEQRLGPRGFLFEIKPLDAFNSILVKKEIELDE